MLKRIVEYIKILFDVDIRLRKWCVKQMNAEVGYPMDVLIPEAKKLYEFIKGPL